MQTSVCGGTGNHIGQDIDDCDECNPAYDASSPYLRSLEPINTFAIYCTDARLSERAKDAAMQAKVRSVFACLSIAVHFDATEL